MQIREKSIDYIVYQIKFVFIVKKISDKHKLYYSSSHTHFVALSPLGHLPSCVFYKMVEEGATKIWHIYLDSGH